MESTDRLRKLILSFNGIGYKNVNELARKAGVNQSILSEFLSGKRELISFKVIWKAMEVLGFSLPEPNGRVQSLTASERLPKITMYDETTDMQAVAVFDVAGAGPAVEISELEPIFLVKSSPIFLRQANFAVLVQGHSMEPKIPNGSIVGVKRDVEFRANDLYVARIPYEGLVIKHITVDREAEEFVFHSYNPDRELYPDFRVGIHESESIIIGRVVWITIPN